MDSNHESPPATRNQQQRDRIFTTLSIIPLALLRRFLILKSLCQKITTIVLRLLLGPFIMRYLERHLEPIDQQDDNNAQCTLLQLPYLVREEIYYQIFASSRVRVCSFNKDHTAATFARGERCQVLLTCRMCYEEALPLLYAHVEFEIVKKSSLAYFTFHPSDQLRAASVRRLVLDREVLPAFESRLFRSLRSLVVTVPGDLWKGERVGNDDYSEVLHSVKRLSRYSDLVKPYIGAGLRGRFAVALRFHIWWSVPLSDEHHEMLLIYLDRNKIVRDSHPFEYEVADEWLSLPSAEDAMKTTSDEECD